MIMKKTVLKSLPTKEELCVWENYNSCIRKLFKENVKQVFNCSISFLGQNNMANLAPCSNQVTLDTIKEIKIALNQNKYGECQDVKPCNHVEYIADKVSTHPYRTVRWTEIRILFKNFIVEEIVDSYVYNYNIIFSEVGGALGVLVGFSGMTLIDYFISTVNFFSKSLHKKGY